MKSKLLKTLLILSATGIGALIITTIITFVLERRYRKYAVMGIKDLE